jgi:hypothetical protein
VLNSMGIGRAWEIWISEKIHNRNGILVCKYGLYNYCVDVEEIMNRDLTQQGICVL